MVSELVPRSASTTDSPAYWFLNSLGVVMATSESTGGAFSMVHQTTPPGHATPYHLHRNEDEAFYVLDGEFTFICEGQRQCLVRVDISFCRAIFRMGSDAVVPFPPACSSWRCRVRGSWA
jgi:quercetin dioxygenase-like cupin family protein